jgi:hypothetical protein
MQTPLDQARAKAFKTAQVAMRNHARSGNPLYLFEAAGACLEADMPLPEEARIHVANALIALGKTQGKLNNSKTIVFECLGINRKAGPSVFIARQKFEMGNCIRRVRTKLKHSLQED